MADKADSVYANMSFKQLGGCIESIKDRICEGMKGHLKLMMMLSYRLDAIEKHLQLPVVSQEELDHKAEQEMERMLQQFETGGATECVQ